VFLTENWLLHIIQAVDLLQTLVMIRRFGTWPVPVISENRKDGVVLEGPVCKQNQVVGWHTSEDNSKLRRFHVAMSGFAFNSTMLWDPKLRSHVAWNSIRHPEMVKEGLQVSCLFLFSPFFIYILPPELGPNNVLFSCIWRLLLIHFLNTKLISILSFLHYYYTTLDMLNFMKV